MLSEAEGRVEAEVEGNPRPVRTKRVEGWRLYILLCRNGAYYIGVTNDLQRRWEEHRTGRGGHYTKCNPPVRLVYTEQFPSRQQAEARERQLKGWTRAKKAALIAGDLPRLKQL